MNIFFEECIRKWLFQCKAGFIWVEMPGNTKAKHRESWSTDVQTKWMIFQPCGTQYKAMPEYNCDYEYRYDGGYVIK